MSVTKIPTDEMIILDLCDLPYGTNLPEPYHQHAVIGYTHDRTRLFTVREEAFTHSTFSFTTGVRPMLRTFTEIIPNIRHHWTTPKSVEES